MGIVLTEPNTAMQATTSSHLLAAHLLAALATVIGAVTLRPIPATNMLIIGD